jgi:hypothetical protein
LTCVVGACSTVVALNRARFALAEVEVDCPVPAAFATTVPTTPSASESAADAAEVGTAAGVEAGMSA